MSATFVVDCSIALAWCFAEEATAATRQLLDQMSREVALVPDLWFLELANVLFVAQRKSRITEERIDAYIELVNSFELVIDYESSARAFSNLLPICRTHGLTAYDAVYLDLAVRRQLPLATLDQPLRQAAANVGVGLLG